MRKKEHFLSNIDPNQKLGFCSKCNVVVKLYGDDYHGWKCAPGHNERRRGKTHFWEKPYLHFKETYCRRCGFTPVHPSQLDVDHINGDHKDDSPSNLQTLCANCHRLKTWDIQSFKHPIWV